MGLDKKTSLKELKDEVQYFCEERDWDQFHNPKDLAIGIITEASELLELFRFKSLHEMDEMLKDEKKKALIGEEIADVFFFLLRFVQMNDMDLSELLLKKIQINETKYPIETAKGSNKKYTEGFK